MIKFTVYGKPVPQGSKRAQVIYSKGQPVWRNGRVLAVVVNANKDLGNWRNQVAEAALAAFLQGHPVESPPSLITGPVSLSIIFLLARPKSHYRTGRYAGLLKESAPVCHAQRPDRDKLARAVGDALKGIVYRDDGQICCGDVIKRWGERYETIVAITEL